ncbi:MAG: RNA ligase, partial [Clostridia bacterium]
MITKYDNILTYEEAKLICERYNNFNFRETVHYMNGFKVCNFSYKLCTPTMFFNPIEENKDVTSINMRGMCFVYNTDGTLYKTYLMLPKFFNINQCEITQYNELKKYEIEGIYKKLDGTLISFIELPDGQIIPKTINSFDNEQCMHARNIYNKNKSIRDIVRKALDRQEVPCFEFISPNNRIVLKYKETSLELLGYRNYITGEWNPVSNNDIEFNLDIDNIISYAKTSEEHEGWVVKFTNGLLTKIKTSWYCNLHGLCTEDIHRENKIIYHYLNENSDNLYNLIAASDAYNKITIDKCIASVDNFKELLNENNLKLQQIFND